MGRRQVWSIRGEPEVPCDDGPVSSPRVLAGVRARGPNLGATPLWNCLRRESAACHVLTVHGNRRGSVVPSKAEKIMAQARSPIEQVLRQIDRMSEEQQCELLEAMLLKQRRSDLGWGMIKRIRSTLPRRSEQQVKRDVDTAIQQVRREQSRTARA